ncbi:hypothetical protein A0H81_12617 [Grifola frondosa]|uniref:Uncharacterized protein n=1 Tax=Grifola frondosa TaxID=5627 RepID=A0A1C7LRM5_GRIFR|nr:hypothetical protein A0H81_12617 [Grifola frondosa]
MPSYAAIEPRGVSVWNTFGNWLLAQATSCLKAAADEVARSPAARWISLPTMLLEPDADFIPAVNVLGVVHVINAFLPLIRKGVPFLSHGDLLKHETWSLRRSRCEVRSILAPVSKQLKVIEAVGQKQCSSPPPPRTHWVLPYYRHGKQCSSGSRTSRSFWGSGSACWHRTIKMARCLCRCISIGYVRHTRRAYTLMYAASQPSRTVSSLAAISQRGCRR